MEGVLSHLEVFTGLATAVFGAIAVFRPMNIELLRGHAQVQAPRRAGSLLGRSLEDQVSAGEISGTCVSTRSYGMAVEIEHIVFDAGVGSVRQIDAVTVLSMVQIMMKKVMVNPYRLIVEGVESRVVAGKVVRITLFIN